jgi:hypothetical protein
MAKRPTAPRSKVVEGDAPAQPKPRRTRTTAAPAPATAAEQAPMGPTVEPTEEDIRRRAYERYLARGGNHGLHFDDWVEAEKELKTKK